MSFLQPWLLLALPAVALPIIIHLLNQRRHQAVPWAASAFVKQISKQNRGHAVIRQWMILLLRMLAIATVIFALSRPLATMISGLSMLGTGREQFVLVDRSPSMALRDTATGMTRRESLLKQLDALHDQIGVRSQRQLIEPHRLTHASYVSDDLVSLPDTQVSGVTSDIPALVESAIDRIEQDTLGPTDIWVCSDMHAADWKMGSGRWKRIRQRLAGLSGTKLRVLKPAKNTSFNIAVSVTNVVRRQSNGRAYLEVDFAIRQTGGSAEARTIPVLIRVAGMERRLDVALVAGRYEAKQIRVDLPEKELRGGGVIELPSDANDADNRYYFSFAPPTPRKTVIVSDDEDVCDLLQLVCTTRQLEGVSYECELLPVRRGSEVNWSETSLIVWHAPLPTGDLADRLETFVELGRSVLFLPYEESRSQAGIFGVHWKAWSTPPNLDGSQKSAGTSSEDSLFRITRWRRDVDLLATDADGQVLPVGASEMRKAMRSRIHECYNSGIVRGRSSFPDACCDTPRGSLLSGDSPDRKLQQFRR